MITRMVMITRLPMVGLLTWLMTGAAVAAIEAPPLTVDPGDDLFAPGPGAAGTGLAEPRPQALPPAVPSAAAPRAAAPNVAAPSATPPDSERAPRGNPLWAIPLSQLRAIRERPLFSPSRRPPPAAAATAAPAAAAPPKPAEPDKPPLTLVGTITSHAYSIGLFTNSTDRSMVRLKAGETHAGWVLRMLRPRQAVLAKGQKTATLELLRDTDKAGPVPAAPPARPPVAPGNGAPAAAADKVAATPAAPDNPASPIDPSSLTANPKPRGGGFRMPPPKPGSTPPVPTQLIQPPTFTKPAPPANPFRNTWLR